MASLIDDFHFRCSLFRNLNYTQAQKRLSGLYEWMLETPELKRIITEIAKIEVLDKGKFTEPPAKPEEIASFGIYLFSKIHEGSTLYDLGVEFNIYQTFPSNSIQDRAESVIDQYIEPTIEIIEKELEKLEEVFEFQNTLNQYDDNVNYPLEIHESLKKFMSDNPDFHRNAFIMMQFGDTPAHNQILLSIKNVLKRYGINALRADEKEYHEDLFPNVLTYIHGSKFGIAVFERLEEDEFNPNVSLEVGYLRALKKPICLLRDKTLKALQTDLVGKLYKSFNPQDIENTISKELEKWLRDKDIIT